MSRRVDQAMAHLESEIQRVEQENYSSQPRFKKPDPGDVFGSIMSWIDEAHMAEPNYTPDSRKRDAWLSTFWRKESHLAGVLNGVVSIDKNRGWTLTGGRNQVIRYTNVLRGAEGGRGWRRFFGMAATSYYTTDMGSVVEIGRDGVGGPLRGLYHVDPTRCKLRSDWTRPLEYYPQRGEKQIWGEDEFFRTTSMPDIREDYNQLGFCAQSRVLELAKIMVAVYTHDKEQLGSQAPRGLLLLQNITEDAWDDAMEARQIRLDAEGYQYYGALAVLASVGVENVDAKLIALSQLPVNFDLRQWVDLLMFGYALAVGYDPSEFWPVQSGALGRGRETELQHFKATGKGGMDMVLSFQDNIQQELPDTLQFTFEQRDDTGETLEAQMRREKVRVIKEMYDFPAGVEPIISREEARILLVEQGIIHHDWTEEVDEETESTDIESIRQRRLRDELMGNDTIVRAIDVFPDEPIVKATFDPITGSVQMRVLIPHRDWLLRRRSWATGGWTVIPPITALQLRQSDDVIYFEDETVTITDEDVVRATSDAAVRVGEEYSELMTTEPWEEEEEAVAV